MDPIRQYILEVARYAAMSPQEQVGTIASGERPVALLTEHEYKHVHLPKGVFSKHFIFTFVDPETKTDYGIRENYVIYRKDPESLALMQVVIDLFTKTSFHQMYTTNWHYFLGQALHYSEEEIEEFIRSLRNQP